MKRHIISLLIILFAVFQTASGVDFSEVGNFRIIRNGNYLKLFDGKQYLGDISARKGKDGDISLLKVAVEKGELVIDGSEVFRQAPKAELFMRLNAGNPADTNCENMMTVEMRSDVPGTEGAFSLCGSRKKGAKGGQFWAQPLPRPLLAESRKFTASRFIPPEIGKLYALFYLKPGGKLFIRSIKISLPRKIENKVTDPEKNWVINGGAERGFYMTVPTDLAYLAQPNSGGAFHSQFGVWKKATDYSIDHKEARTGKSSFKIQNFEYSPYNRLTFAPVPVIPGKPLSFSAWMKSDVPAKVQLWFVNSAGSRYVKSFKVTQEWKKYTFTIPKFGARFSGKGAYTTGDPGNTSKYDLNFPSILVAGKATVHVDDVRCQHKMMTSDEGEEVPVRVTGKLDRESSYYFAGEPMTAEIDIDSDRNGSGTIGWKLYDFFGNVIAEGKPVNISFPLKRKFTVDVPQEKRGSMYLLFSVIPEGASPIEQGFPCGVIDKAKKLDPRFGLNMVEQRDPQELIAVMKDFGIGSIRLWWNNLSWELPQSDSSAAFHKAGIFVLYSLARAYRFMLPKDPAEYLRSVEKWIMNATKGNVDLYDLLNEPNAWPVGKNPDPAKYNVSSVEEVVKLEKLMAEVVRRCDPGIPIAAPSTCHTSISYMDSFLRLGGAEFTDILTEHPYRAFAEMPDYYKDIQAMRKFSKDYGKNFRMLSSENGIVRPSFNRHGVFEEQERIAVEKQVRIMLTALAGGMEQYYSFTCGALNPGLSFTDTLVAANSGKEALLPGPIFYCMNAASTALRDASPVKQIVLGFEFRCYLFRRNDGSSCALLWKWHGEPAKIAFSSEMKGCDMMGSRIGGREFLLSPAPIYLDSPLAPEELEKQIRNAKLEMTGAVALAQLVAAGENSFFVKVGNLSPSVLSGKVEIDREFVKGANIQSFTNLEPQRDLMVTFESAAPLSLKKQFIKGRILADGRKPVEFKLDFSGLASPRTPKKLQIDGDLSDWPANAASFTLDSSCAAAPWKQTEEEKKIKAEGKICWDKENLYVAVVVNKEHQVSDTGKTIQGMWSNDSVQIGFDTLSNAIQPSTGYLDDDFEYWISRLNGKTVVYRANASSSDYDSLGKPLGVINEVPAAIVEKDGKTIYEFAFPTFTVSPFKLTAGSSMRFNIIVNVSNGKVRRGFLQLAPGIGQHPKSPFEFISLTLVDK